MLGAETHFLGNGIKRAYEGKVSKPPQYGFREYNLGLSDEFEDSTLFEVPFDKVSLYITFVSSI